MTERGTRDTETGIGYLAALFHESSIHLYENLPHEVKIAAPLYQQKKMNGRPFMVYDGVR